MRKRFVTCNCCYQCLCRFASYVQYMIVDVSHNQSGWFRVFKEEQVANEFHLL